MRDDTRSRFCLLLTEWCALHSGPQSLNVQSLMCAYHAVQSLLMFTNPRNGDLNILHVFFYVSREFQGRSQFEQEMHMPAAQCGCRWRLKVGHAFPPALSRETPQPSSSQYASFTHQAAVTNVSVRIVIIKIDSLRVSPLSSVNTNLPLSDVRHRKRPRLRSVRFQALRYAAPFVLPKGQSLTAYISPLNCLPYKASPLNCLPYKASPLNCLP